jgi:hypothetical protein
MLRLGKRDSCNWHENIHIAAQEFSIIGWTYVWFKPLLWSKLNCHTTSYLIKKGNIDKQERDKRLRTLIQQHKALYRNEFDISVAACARFMSADAVQSVLREESKSVAAGGTKLISFLRATMAAHHENPLAITKKESQLADTLNKYYRPPLPKPRTATMRLSRKWLASNMLEMLVKSLVAGFPSDAVMYPLYPLVLRLVEKNAPKLRRWVGFLKDSSQWIEAWRVTGWLSEVLARPRLPIVLGYREAQRALDIGFPEWRLWAEWKPCDKELARGLDRFVPLGFNSPSDTLEYLIRMQMDINPIAGSFVYEYVCEMIRKSSAELAGQVAALKESGCWFTAHKVIGWLSILLVPSNMASIGTIESIRLLELEFPEWRAWAEWRPNVNRLKAQTRLTALQRHSLLGLLALEGPDFQSSKRASIRKSLLALGIEFRSVDDDRNIFESLSSLVAAACNTEPVAIDLLAQLHCDSAGFDENLLKILEESSRLADPLVMADILQILKAEKRDQSSQMTAVMRLLPKFGFARHQALREAVAPRLVDCISTCMREMQALLSKGLKDIRLVMKLHAFGKGVQAAQWLCSLLDDPLEILILNWPNSERIAAMNDLQSYIQKTSSGQVTSLCLQLDRYYREYLVEACTIDQETKDLIQSLVDLWAQPSSGAHRRAIALRIAQAEKMTSLIRLDCLKQLPNFPDKSVADLRQIVESSAEEPDQSCVSLARLLAGSLYPDHKDIACWVSMLFDWCMIGDSMLLEYTTKVLKRDDWYQWISDVQLVSPNMDALDPQACPKVFQLTLHAWVRRISPYKSTIQQVECVFGMGSPSQCFRAGFDSQNDDIIIQILKLLKDKLINWDGGGTLPPAVHASLSLLKRDGANARQLHRALSCLSEVTTDGNDFYLRINEIYQGSSPAVASALLAFWLKTADIAEADMRALESLGDLLEIRLSSDESPDVEAWAASKYISDEIAALHVELQRLSSLRRSLKLKDPIAVSALCGKLGINDTSALDDELACLPFELVNVVEMVDEDTVELHFPLAHLTTLQRAGMGTGSSKSLIVRLILGNNSLPAGFCIHLDNETGALAKSGCHSPWLVLDESAYEGTALCYGQINRATYQLGRILSHDLLNGSKALKETYNMLKLSLDSMLDVCIVCGSPHGVRLQRSACCESSACSLTYKNTNLEIQLNDFREDPQVADLLLTAVQAAVTSKHMNLLPGCTGSRLEPIAGILDKLPPISALRASKDMHALLQHWGNATLHFLKWISGHYRGFLVSATGRTRTSSMPVQIRIPNMPGAYQFLLTNAAPHLEKAFAAKVGRGTTTVVFHGTSLDRLFSILCLGLQNFSGTQLGRHGASYGNGIYVAEEPATSFAYMQRNVGLPGGGTTVYHSSCDRYNVVPGWSSGTFNGFGVLLACEASGIVHGKGIHVISDPSTLLLRYIFLIPPNMAAPRAAAIVPAISNVLASLRSRAL